MVFPQSNIFCQPANKNSRLQLKIYNLNFNLQALSEHKIQHTSHILGQKKNIKIVYFQVCITEQFINLEIKCNINCSFDKTVLKFCENESFCSGNQSKLSLLYYSCRVPLLTRTKCTKPLGNHIAVIKYHIITKTKPNQELACKRKFVNRVFPQKMLQERGFIYTACRQRSSVLIDQLRKWPLAEVILSRTREVDSNTK